MSDCIFCQIIQNQNEKFLYEDEQLIVIKDIYPKAPVHLLVIPKIHIKSLMELEPHHATLMSNLILLLPKLAKDYELDDGFRTIVNTGPGGGQVVPHIHFHLLGGGKIQNL